MQFDLENIKNLLGKVVYIDGQALPNLEPYIVCGYDHSDNFLQMCSLVSGKYISGLHPSNVVLADIGKTPYRVVLETKIISCEKEK